MSLISLLKVIPEMGSLATVWSLCALWLSFMLLARSLCPCTGSLLAG